MSQPLTNHFENNRDKVKAKKDLEFVGKLENAILHASGLSGTYYAGPWHDDVLHTLMNTREGCKAPPDELRHWYNLGDENGYLATGKSQADLYRHIYAEQIGAFVRGDHIVEIGCSAGRIIRWFEPEAQSGVNVWGFDIDSAAIMWAQTYLSPNLRFVTNTTAAHLPLRDGAASLVYGNSLFTHIGELSDLWLMEIARILNDERGLAILTFNDDAGIEMARKKDPSFGRHLTTKRAYEQTQQLQREGVTFGKLIFNSTPWQQSVWYNRQFLLERLKLVFDVVDIIDGFSGQQTGYVLRPLGRSGVT